MSRLCDKLSPVIAAEVDLILYRALLRRRMADTTRVKEKKAFLKLFLCLKGLCVCKVMPDLTLNLWIYKYECSMKKAFVEQLDINW